MPKLVLTKKQIHEMANELAGSPKRADELRVLIAIAPLDSQRVIKGLWKLKQKAERLSESEMKTSNSTKRRQS